MNIFIIQSFIYKVYILMLLLDKNLGIGGLIKLIINDSWVVKVFFIFMYSRIKQYFYDLEYVVGLSFMIIIDI